jgi:hypothetical protein
MLLEIKQMSGIGERQGTCEDLSASSRLISQRNMGISTWLWREREREINGGRERNGRSWKLGMIFQTVHMNYNSTQNIQSPKQARRHGPRLSSRLLCFGPFSLINFSPPSPNLLSPVNFSRFTFVKEGRKKLKWLSCVVLLLESEVQSFALHQEAFTEEHRCFRIPPPRTLGAAA